MKAESQLICMLRVTKENVFDYIRCHFYSLFATFFFVTNRLSFFEPHLIYLNNIFRFHTLLSSACLPLLDDSRIYEGN